MVKKESANEIWEGNKKKHLSKNPLLKFLLRKFNRDVVNLLKSQNPKTLLDVGCGEGFTTREIASSLSDSQIVGVDIEKEFIEYARKYSARPNITYQMEDLFAMPNTTSPQYACVMANELLEHLPDVRSALELFCRLSKRLVLISVPNEPWFRIANFLRGKYIKNLGNTPGHINHWTKPELIRLLSGYGRIITAKTSTFWNIVIFERG